MLNTIGVPVGVPPAFPVFATSEDSIMYATASPSTTKDRSVNIDYNPWPTDPLVHSVAEARLLVGFLKKASKGASQDAQDLAVRLGKLLGTRQPPDSPGIWCCVFGPDGAAAVVFWSAQRRYGFCLPRHPEISEKILAIDENFTRYRHTLWTELRSLSASEDAAELKQSLHDLRARAAASVLPLEPVTKGKKDPSTLRTEHVNKRRQVIHEDQIELFTLTNQPHAEWRDDSRHSEAPAPDLPSVVNQLLLDYNREGAFTAYVGASAVPSKAKIVRITQALLSILFPGYYGPRPNSRHFRAFLERRLWWLRRQLSTQISRALHFQHNSDAPDANPVMWSDDDYNEWAEEKADALLSALPRIRRILEEDVKAALNGDPAVWDHHEIVVAYPGIYAIAVYRLAHELDQVHVPLIPRIMTEHAHSKTGIDIHPAASIDSGFFIDHGTGVVIGATSDIGRNCTLYQGVTLGAISFPRDDNGQLIRGEKRHPTLAPGVVIYANASVLGGGTVVGRNSVIGANVQLCHSVPPEKVASVEEYALRVRDRKKLAPKGQQYAI